MTLQNVAICAKPFQGLSKLQTCFTIYFAYDAVNAAGFWNLDLQVSHQTHNMILCALPCDEILYNLRTVAIDSL